MYATITPLCVYSSLALLLEVIFCITEDSKIGNLPGFDAEVPILQYSGYVNGATADVHLHYWFVKSQQRNSSGPLVLWLNGGPGCSSLFGLLLENGPFKLVNGRKLVANPHSWNKVANMLYLESPAGVGFSYKEGGPSYADDDSTALDNYYAIRNFVEKFPEFRGRDFYLTGESYAGIYLPTLAVHLLDAVFVKLKGIFVGNPLTNMLTNMGTAFQIALHYGIIDDRAWNDVVQTCCIDRCDLHCNPFANQTQQCKIKLLDVFTDIGVGANYYNVLSPCAGGASEANWNIHLTAEANRSRISAESTKSPFLCVDDSTIKQYMNWPAVTQALHVRSNVSGPWEACVDHTRLGYVSSYDDMSDTYLKLLRAKIPVTIYSGDVDLICNHMGSRKFVHDLGLKPCVFLEPWCFDDENKFKQIGGWKKIYTLDGTPIRHVTIRGAGHMVPMDKPYEAFLLFSEFIQSRAVRVDARLRFFFFLCVHVKLTI